MLCADRLNERLKEGAKFHLSGDGRHDAADDADGVINNLRQQLTLAVQVSRVLWLPGVWYVC